MIHFDSEEVFWKEYTIIMTIGEKIQDEKVQCDVNRETTKIHFT